MAHPAALPFLAHKEAVLILSVAAAGQVIEVTNLNDSGPGSLRACIGASGPRTCVFRVAGIIHPTSRVQASNPYLTIAGQSAPGGGIVLSGDQMNGDALMFVATHDVIVRYISCSAVTPAAAGPQTGSDCLETASGAVYNVVFDHVTGRWWNNKPFVSYDNVGGATHSTTLQWSLFYEPGQLHPVGPLTDNGAGGALLDTDQDEHHNMWANTRHRLPMVNVGSMRWVNNIVYNWDYFAAEPQGGVKVDFIASKYLPGNLNTNGPNPQANPSGQNPHEINANNTPSSDNPVQDIPGPPQIYMLNNLGPNNSSVTGVPNDASQAAMTATIASEGGPEVSSPMSAAWFRSTPLPTEKFPIVADPVTNLDNVLLPTVGNSQGLACDGTWFNRRDSVDARIIAQYRSNGPGWFFTVVDADHVTPSIDPGTVCTESLHDGIPDQWKALKGLSLTDPNLYKGTAPNGYTYLENYLNGL